MQEALALDSGLPRSLPPLSPLQAAYGRLPRATPCAGVLDARLLLFDMRFAFISGHSVARDEWPVWLEAAVLAAGHGHEVAIVFPDVGLRWEIDPRVADLGVRILFCPLKPVWGWVECLRIGRAKRLEWWMGRFAEPPDAVCLAAGGGQREALPGCMEWLKNCRRGYVLAGRVAPEDRKSEIGDREPENYEPRMTRMGTDEEAATGRRPGCRAGASESDSLISKLADSPVSESLTRSASIPASIPATSYSLPATAPEALVGGAEELLEEMCRVAARNGVSRYHKWSGLPFLWDEEWI